METTKDYKQEIIATRKGCLGSSDGALLAQVATLGYVPKSANKRLAIVKGLAEQENYSSKAMLFGDFAENSIFDMLHAKDERYESNPLWVSGKYRYKNVTLISHPDIVLKDDKKKVLYVYEVKATIYDTPHTKATYKNQLFIHWLLANEIINDYDDAKRWKVKVNLVRYDTKGIDMDDEWVFDPNRVEISPCHIKRGLFNMDNAMRIIDKYIEELDTYYEEDVINADLLPEKVKQEFDMVADALMEIKAREIKVEEFKKKLYEFMKAKEIKSVKNDVFTITRIDPSESHTFDHKKFLDDLSNEHPRKARALKRKYDKTTIRSGYAKITIK